IVPDRMMHDLKMPFPLSGLQIDRDQALAKKIVSRSVPAIEVRSRRLHRQVDYPQLFVHGDLSPDARVAVHAPGIVEPRVVAKFTRPGNRMESPKLFACPYIECADLSLDVVMSDDRHAFLHSHPDDDHIFSYDRR